MSEPVNLDTMSDFIYRGFRVRFERPNAYGTANVFFIAVQSPGDSRWELLSFGARLKKPFVIPSWEPVHMSHYSRTYSAQLFSDRYDAIQNAMKTIDRCIERGKPTY